MQITCNRSNAYHVQHVVRHVVRKGSSTSKFDRVEIAFILAFYWLKPLTNEGGEETGVPGEKHWQQASENQSLSMRLIYKNVFRFEQMNVIHNG